MEKDNSDMVNDFDHAVRIADKVWYHSCDALRGNSTIVMHQLFLHVGIFRGVLRFHFLITSLCLLISSSLIINHCC